MLRQAPCRRRVRQPRYRLAPLASTSVIRTLLYANTMTFHPRQRNIATTFASLLLAITAASLGCGDTRLAAATSPYAVYDALLAQKTFADYQRPGAPFAVVGETWFPSDFLRAAQTAALKADRRFGGPESVERLLYANRQSMPLDSSRFAVRPVLIQPTDIGKLQGNWLSVMHRYPGTGVVFRLSRPAYDTKYAHAIVLYDFLCGELCGHLGIAHLALIDQRWVVTNRYAVELY